MDCEHRWGKPFQTDEQKSVELYRSGGFRECVLCGVRKLVKWGFLDGVD